MPAYFDTGFSVRQPMWHGLGEVLDDYPESWDDARRKAGLMWEPTYRDLYVPQLIPVTAEVPEGAHLIGQAEGDQRRYLVPVQGHRAIVRDDTEAVLATPTDSYELIYHHQMGELLEAYTEAWTKAGADVKFETAGSVRDGRAVWALVWLDEPYTVPGDDSATYPFAALLNAHDGSAACKLLPTQVRVVCWNTWNAASMAGDRTGHQVVIRHSGNVADRIDQAKQGLAAMRDEAQEWQLIAEDLAGININDAVVRTFLDEFIPIPEGASERTRNSRQERRDTFRKLYDESPTCAALPETAYKLTQAAGEYLDHLRPFRSRDTYLSRTMLTADSHKPAVVRLVRELATDLVPA